MDGGHQLEPASVLCSRINENDHAANIVKTTLFHDMSMSGIVITGSVDPGTIRKSLKYGLNGDQLDRFIEGFDDCEQVIFSFSNFHENYFSKMMEPFFLVFQLQSSTRLH